jgi:hypothetical protein
MKSSSAHARHGPNSDQPNAPVTKIPSTAHASLLGVPRVAALRFFDGGPQVEEPSNPCVEEMQFSIVS